MSEIAFWIEAAECEKHSLLVIRLGEVEKEGFNFKTVTATPLSYARLRQLTPAKDKEALEALIKEETQFQCQLTGRAPHLESTQFSLMHVSAAQAISIIQLLATTQKLFFQHKQLVVDLLGKTELYYRVEVLNDKQIQVSAHLKWRDTDIPLSSCDAIGPGKPCWFIKGVSLKIISTDMTWKSLKHAYQHSTWILEGAQKRQFLEDLDPEDPDHPRLVFVGGDLQTIVQSAEPLPILILKDRVGAFADLWMNYGSHQIAYHDLSQQIKDSSGKPLFKRQMQAEKNWEKDLLETNFTRKDVSSSHYYCPVDKVAKSLAFLLELGWMVKDWKEQEVVRHGALDLQVNESGQAITIKGRLSYQSYEANLTDIIGAFNRREQFVQLAPGKVGLLPDRTEIRSVGELAEEGEINGQEIRIKRNRLSSLPSLFDEVQLPPNLADLKERLQQFSQIETAEPHSDFKGQLRAYQQQGLNWLNFLVQYGFHGILADDMGLGKTVQVIALLSRLPKTHPHLIVVPTSLLFNWKNEIERFLPNQAIYVHTGSQRAASSQEISQHSLILTSYALLRLDLPLFQSLTYQSLILDEAQTIKNAHTQIAQAIYSLQAHFRLSITGTPIENHLGELWSQFRFLMPDLLGSEASFQADLQAAQSDSRYLQKIKKKIVPFILRRKKEEVAKDLPEKINQLMWVEMSPDQREIYEQFLSDIKRKLFPKVKAEGVQKHRMEILEALLRLRQICCHPLLVSSLIESETIPLSAKFEALTRDLETAVEEGHKVLIYSQFTSMLKIMAKEAQQQGWAYAYLDGATTNREQVVARFQEDPAVSLFFISLKAGGVGLNLTAADYVFLYDPWWNEAVEEQAINRAHRIGRQETVVAKRFVTVESIEEKIVKLKAAKKLLIEDIFSDESSPLNLTFDDLQFLLG